MRSTCDTVWYTENKLESGDDLPSESGCGVAEISDSCSQKTNSCLSTALISLTTSSNTFPAEP